MPSLPMEREPVVQPQDDSICLIPLTGGKVTIVDKADYDFLNQWAWYTYTNKGGMVYAARARHSGESGPYTIFMHRVLMKPNPRQES